MNSSVMIRKQDTSAKSNVGSSISSIARSPFAFARQTKAHETLKQENKKLRLGTERCKQSGKECPTVSAYNWKRNGSRNAKRLSRSEDRRGGNNLNSPGKREVGKKR